LLATDEMVTVIREDARDYQAILSALERDRLIDLAEPVCVLFVSMLHFMTAAESDALVGAFRERVAPGSYLVISAGVSTERNIPAGEQIQAAYGDRTTLTGRPAAEIAAYFGDFELVPPGLVPVTDWPLEGPGTSQRPVLQEAAAPTKAGMMAGIGRKRS